MSESIRGGKIMSIGDGGPAFPSANQVRLGDMATGGHAGMTLRDYFAAKAIASGMCPHNAYEGIRIAEWAYEIADFMLAEREK